MTARQKRTVGDIVAVPLSTGRYGFGQVLGEPLIAFFDFEAADAGPEVLADLVDRAVVFKVWVMNHAVKAGRWKVIGRLDISQSLQEIPKFFKQDSVSGKFSITTDGGDEIPATREQCEKLERASVWDPSHVEDRLVDHFEGRPNKWVESLRPR